MTTKLFAYVVLLTNCCVFLHAAPSENNRQTFNHLQQILATATILASQYQFEQSPAEPDPLCCQTTQGLYLVAKDYPHHLATPWGAVPLYVAHPGYDKQHAVRATVALLAQLHFSFFGAMPDHDNVLGVAWAVSTESLAMKNLRGKKLSQKGFEKALDTKKIIYASAASSVYAITSVGGTPSPTPTTLDRENFRSKEGVVAEWTELKESYTTLQKQS